MPRTYNEIDARVTRLMKELENLKKELAGKQGILEDGDGIVLTPDVQTNKTTVSVDENVVALKEDFEANPTLAGTEPVLEGLKLLGTDYKVGGGGDLYLHSLTINTASYSSGVYKITLLLKRDTAFTSPQDLIQYLYSLTQADNIIGFGVFVTEQNADYKVFGLSVAYNGSYLRYRYRDGATNNIPATEVTDTVTKL